MGLRSGREGAYFGKSYRQRLREMVKGLNLPCERASVELGETRSYWAPSSLCCPGNCCSLENSTFIAFATLSVTLKHLNNTGRLLPTRAVFHPLHTS